jgi:adenylosuccinate lyase
VIPRYTRPEMAAIWEPGNRYAVMLRVELLACEAWNRLGRIPDEALAEIRARAGFDAARIDEIEREVKHDVIAFLTSVAEKVGPSSRFIHLGLTSSDVLDTALAVQMAQAADLLLEGVGRCREAVRAQALRHRGTVMMGRTHGMHAEPTTFGLVLAVWCEELGRAERRLAAARAAVAVGKLSGAVGTFSNLPLAVEEHVCRELHLAPASVSSQVIQRDRHAEYACALALAGSSLEKFAVNIRHLARTEVGEVEEPFTPGQKGSSAMPHKKNPILAENITGLARLLRGYAVAALEDVALWHERDISHSSVERVILPDATIALDFALHRFAGLMEGLVVHPDRMRANMDLSGGITFSQALLLALVDAGMSREEGYRVVQRNAHSSREGGHSFQDRVEADPEVRKLLGAEKLKAVFDPRSQLARVDEVFARVFGDGV